MLYRENGHILEIAHGAQAFHDLFLLLVTATLLAVPPRAGGEGSVTSVLSAGVRASLKHRIIVEQETWPSALAETLRRHYVEDAPGLAGEVGCAGSEG